MEPRAGHYLGTEIDERWSRRYREGGFFARGNGTYWFDEQGFYFHRYFTREPLHLPFGMVREIKTGTWHAGRWVWGLPIVKVVWSREGGRLSSGFMAGDTRESNLAFEEEFGRRLAEYHAPR